MDKVEEARGKVNEAIELLASVARSGRVSQEIVRELDCLCNNMLDDDYIFDYILDHYEDA